MSVISTASGPPFTPAAVRGAPASTSSVAAAATEDRLTRARERLYVLCQLGGWGFFAVLQAVYTELAGPKFRGGLDEISAHAINIFIVFLALLLTHFSRRFIHRWGWKEMRWGRLVPRIIGMSFVISTVWCLVGFGVVYGLIGVPWKSPFSATFTISATIVNGTIMLLGWFCIYFIYHIYDRVQRLQVEQLRLAASVKEAELRALKSQVNPHFLFNSLNSLRALIDEDAPRARESVTRLANMLRYSLSSGQLETVPLEDELRVVEDYLALEQIRHESRLRVRLEISPDARRQSVPPMLLQTLVENAVKYGISTRRGGGEIAISAMVEHGELRLRVTNPGELAAPVSPSAARAGSSTGVGLRNASERLKLLYGDRAMLRLLAEPAECVTADVHIPIRMSPA
jgi:GNAT superfamily N-acetyltransferase